MIEIDPEHEDEFNRWYEQEHIPEKLEVPGFRSARRFQADDGASRYLAVYELDDVSVPTSEEYMSQTPTEWTERLRPYWRDWSRSVWVEITD